MRQQLRRVSRVTLAVLAVVGGVLTFFYFRPPRWNPWVTEETRVHYLRAAGRRGDMEGLDGE